MNIILTSKIEQDEYTRAISKFYDLAEQDSSVVIVKDNIQLPQEDWKIGVIYGSSGSGKTTLLKKLGKIKTPSWNNKSTISNFAPLEPKDAFKALNAVGFNTVPAWLRPYSVLSNGEQFRANLARLLADNEAHEPILIDEYTSVVDRNVAKSASAALSRYIKQSNKQIIVASCHADILEWLSPDWIYNTDEGLTHYPRGTLQRPKIDLEIFRCKYETWELFKSHHYLSDTLNKAARCFGCSWNGQLVGFIAILALPHPKLKNAWRATRMVVLPDFQGLGIGGMLADYMGSVIAGRNDGQFYRRIAHPAVISYNRKRPNLWKEMKSGSSAFSESSRMLNGSDHNGAWHQRLDRETVGFKYIGPAASEDEAKLFYDSK